jgi:hypothetical protein
VLAGGILYHLPKFLQCIKYIILENLTFLIQVTIIIPLTYFTTFTLAVFVCPEHSS